MIQCYKSDNADYERNGDTTLFPTSCGLSCEINGAWELNMSHPQDSEGRWKYLEEETVIAAPTFQSDKQLFRVDKCIKTDSSMEVTAYPIFFDSADDCFLMDVRPTGKNGQEALDIMTAGSKYSGESDITTGGTAYFVRRNLMDAINGEDSPTFCQVWGGEILYDNQKVIINKRIGGDHGVEIRYGKNMDGLSHTIDMSEVVTRIIPVAYNGRTMSGDAPWVDSDNIDKYAKKYIREVKFEDVKLAEDASDGDEDNGIIVCQDQAALDEVLTQKCEDMYAAGADLPAVTIEVTMIDLSRTEQYKDFQELVTVGLGDTVHCYNYKLGITTEARVIKLTWDCIRDQAGEMTLGDYEYNYFSDLTSSLQAIQQVIGPGNTLVAERVSGVLNAINTQLRYQKNIAQNQDVRAILFEDTDQESPTYGAMCLGTQGFQIADSRTEDERDWDWTTAFTAKGGYANTLIAGLLADKTGRSYWDLDTGDMQMTGTFRQIAQNGYKSVDIENNHISFYSWLENGDYVGGAGAIKRASDGRTGVEMWCKQGDILWLGYDTGTGADGAIKPIFTFDSSDPSKTPAMINTASGTIFPDNPTGGIVVENGLIKEWELTYTNGTLSLISGLAWSGGNITRIHWADIVVKDGMIMSWTSRQENY